jgi:hypothetical protein
MNYQQAHDRPSTQYRIFASNQYRFLTTFIRKTIQHYVTYISHQIRNGLHHPFRR